MKSHCKVRETGSKKQTRSTELNWQIRAKDWDSIGDKSKRGYLVRSPTMQSVAQEASMNMDSTERATRRSKAERALDEGAILLVLMNQEIPSFRSGGQG